MVLDGEIGEYSQPPKASLLQHTLLEVTIYIHSSHSQIHSVVTINCSPLV